MRALTLDLAHPLAGVHLEAVMLWPDSEEVRRNLADAAAAAFVLRSVETQPDLQVLPLGPDGGEMLRWLRAARPREGVDGKSRQRFGEGIVVGTLVVEAILEARDTAAPVDFGRLKATAMARMQRTGLPGLLSRTVKVLDNTIWPTLRPVAHLWAGYVAQRAATGEDPFRAAGGMVSLLSTGESLLAEAANVRLRRTSYRLLKVNDALRVRPST